MRASIGLSRFCFPLAAPVALPARAARPREGAAARPGRPFPPAAQARAWGARPGGPAATPGHRPASAEQAARAVAVAVPVPAAAEQRAGPRPARAGPRAQAGWGARPLLRAGATARAGPSAAAAPAAVATAQAVHLRQAAPAARGVRANWDTLPTEASDDGACCLAYWAFPFRVSVGSGASGPADRRPRAANVDAELQDDRHPSTNLRGPRGDPRSRQASNCKTPVPAGRPRCHSTDAKRVRPPRRHRLRPRPLAATGACVQPSSSG